MTVAVLFVTGFVSVVVVFVLERNEATRAFASAITTPLRILPTFNLGDGFIKLNKNYLLQEIRGTGEDVFDSAVAGAALRAMTISVPVFFVALLLVDAFSLPFIVSRVSEKFAVLNELRNQSDPDGSVTEEGEEEETRSAVAVAKNVWKSYAPASGYLGRLLSGLFWLIRWFRFALVAKDPPKDAGNKGQCRHAVRGVSVTLQQDEILAVVGSNGCGKSSLLGVLSGEIRPTHGSVALEKENRQLCFLPWLLLAQRSRIGLCPQVSRCTSFYERS